MGFLLTFLVKRETVVASFRHSPAMATIRVYPATTSYCGILRNSQGRDRHFPMCLPDGCYVIVATEHTTVCPETLRNLVLEKSREISSIVRNGGVWEYAAPFEDSVNLKV